jgi:hypothetical protein
MGNARTLFGFRPPKFRLLHHFASYLLFTPRHRSQSMTVHSAAAVGITSVTTTGGHGGRSKKYLVKSNSGNSAGAAGSNNSSSSSSTATTKKLSSPQEFFSSTAPLTFAQFKDYLTGEVILNATESVPPGKGHAGGCSDPGAKPTPKQLRRLFNMFDVDGDGVLKEEELAKFNSTVVERVNGLRSALIVVDFQNDFVSGSLSIKVRHIH